MDGKFKNWIEHRDEDGFRTLIEFNMNYIKVGGNARGVWLTVADKNAGAGFRVWLSFDDCEELAALLDEGHRPLSPAARQLPHGSGIVFRAGWACRGGWTCPCSAVEAG
jgi:hypothetical protein